jgi:hypothetical protein
LAAPRSSARALIAISSAAPIPIIMPSLFMQFSLVWNGLFLSLD